MRDRKCLGFFALLTIVLVFFGCFGSTLDAPLPPAGPNGFPPNPNPLPTPAPHTGEQLSITGPVVSPEQPTGVVSGIVDLTATPAGPSIAVVQFYANGNSVGVVNAAPYTMPFDTRTLTTATVAFKARVIAVSGDAAVTDEATFAVDNTSPVITSFTARSGNSADPPGTYSGMVRLECVATDNTAIAHVDFKMDGTTLLGSVNTTPYVFNWDSGTVQNGPHVVTAEVFDVTASGNQATSPPIQAQIANGGAAITITNPVDGVRVSGIIRISAHAVDSSGVTELIFTEPAGLVDTNSAPDIFEATIDTTTLPEGRLRFTARATNGLNQWSFQSVSPIIDNIPFDGAISLVAASVTGGDFGAVVAFAGDTNGDGFDDVVLASPHADQLAINAGMAMVFLGPTFTTAVTISNPEPVFGAMFGASVVALGDIDGDGNADLAIGAPGAQVNSISSSGKVYVLKGPNFSPAQAIIISNPNTQNGERFGTALAAGDFDGDHHKDLVITAPYFSGPGFDDVSVGRAYVVTGPQFTNFTEVPNPDWQFNANFGLTACTIGDVNGDGKDDYAIGSPYYDFSRFPNIQNSGRVWVYRGVNTLHARLEESPAQVGTFFGAALAPAGDLNGDGLPDLLIGVPGAEQGKGRAYYALAPGFVLSSAIVKPGTRQDNDQFGSAVAGLGDANGDGRNDFAVGAVSANQAFVFWGPGFTSTLTLSHPSGAPNIGYGASMAGGGDVNHDGLGDLVVGATSAGVNGGGSVHFNR